MIIAFQWIMSTTLMVGALLGVSSLAQTIPDGERAVLHAEQRMAAEAMDMALDIAVTDHDVSSLITNGVCASVSTVSIRRVTDRALAAPGYRPRQK